MEAVQRPRRGSSSTVERLPTPDWSFKYVPPRVDDKEPQKPIKYISVLTNVVKPDILPKLSYPEPTGISPELRKLLEPIAEDDDYLCNRPDGECPKVEAYGREHQEGQQQEDIGYPRLPAGRSNYPSFDNIHDPRTQQPWAPCKVFETRITEAHLEHAKRYQADQQAAKSMQPDQKMKLDFIMAAKKSRSDSKIESALYSADPNFMAECKHQFGLSDRGIVNALNYEADRLKDAEVWNQTRSSHQSYFEDYEAREAYWAKRNHTSNSLPGASSSATPPPGIPPPPTFVNDGTAVRELPSPDMRLFMRTPDAPIGIFNRAEVDNYRFRQCTAELERARTQGCSNDELAEMQQQIFGMTGGSLDLQGKQAETTLLNERKIMLEISSRVQKSLKNKMEKAREKALKAARATITPQTSATTPSVSAPSTQSSPLKVDSMLPTPPEADVPPTAAGHKRKVEEIASPLDGKGRGWSLPTDADESPSPKRPKRSSTAPARYREQA